MRERERERGERERVGGIDREVGVDREGGGGETERDREIR